MPTTYDVVIVGSGNAAFSAAHAARERVECVLLLEKAPREWAGGNSYFTAGAFRITYESLDELRPILADLTDERKNEIDLPAYTPQDFAADMQRLTHGRCDPELTAILVNEATEVARWLHRKGIRWTLLTTRQAFRVGRKLRFWGGLALGTVGGGPGLIEQHMAAAEATGIEQRYGCPIVGLLRYGRGVVTGVVGESSMGREEVKAGAVILACGGFECFWDLRTTPLVTLEGHHFAHELKKC